MVESVLRLHLFKLSYPRHPLAFLVEAADDICNCALDLEDAWFCKILPPKLVETTLIDLILVLLLSLTSQQL